MASADGEGNKEAIKWPVLGQVHRESLGTLRDLIAVPKGAEIPPHRPEELGTTIEQVQLVAPNGSITVTVCSLGATVTSIKLRNGQEVTFQEKDWMTNYKGYNGRSCGRMAGRTGAYSVPAEVVDIEGGEMDDLHPMVQSQFDPKNEAEVLHGGKVGFAFRVWKLVNSFCSQKCARAVFEVESDHLDQGHPGAIKAEVHIMAVDGENPRFDVRYRARLREDSPCQALINLTSHCYFNLGGADALHHELYLPNAREYFAQHFATEPSAATGKFDFAKRPTLVVSPLDHCFLLSSDPSHASETDIAAVLRSPRSKVKMTVYTTCPGVVVYTAQHANHQGICLEFQYPPNVAKLSDIFREKVTLRPSKGNPAPSPKRSRLSPGMNEGSNTLATRLAAFGRKGSTVYSTPYEYDQLTMHEFSLSDT